MSKTEFINQFVNQAGQLLPNLIPSNKAREELHKNLLAIAQSSFTKLDLVSREEFDAQVAVLQRTRKKVDELEAQIAQLQQQLATDK